MSKELKLLEKLEKIDLSQIMVKPRKRIRLEGFWHAGKHILILGKTGSGKTVLLHNLLIDFYKRGFKIIHRDDGGLEFLKAVDHIDKVTVYYPKTCYFNCDVENVEYVEYDFFKVDQLVKELIDTEDMYNVVLFDIFCKDKELSAIFWAKFFDAFITILMQRHPSEKSKVLLSFDELNDLIQPEKQQLTQTHRKFRSLFEYNIRKLRKHGVKLLCTAHRPNQLTLNIRSQFSFVFIKQSFGWDLYEFLNKELVHISSKVFWWILRDIKDLPVEYAYIFDNGGNYDKFYVPNLREDIPPYYINGILEKEQPEDDFYYRKLWVRIILRRLYNELKYGKILVKDIAEHVGKSYEPVRRHLLIMFDDSFIAEDYYRLMELIRGRVKPKAKRKRVRRLKPYAKGKA